MKDYHNYGGISCRVWHGHDNASVHTGGTAPTHSTAAAPAGMPHHAPACISTHTHGTAPTHGIAAAPAGMQHHEHITSHTHNGST